MIPNKVKVSGIEYDVQFKDIVEMGGNRNYRGKCESNLGIIELAKGMGKDVAEQVFVHELLHACLDQAGYDEHDEDMVNRLGIILHQVLKDNKLSFGEKETIDSKLIEMANQVHPNA